jgi:hypothetical protein
MEQNDIDTYAEMGFVSEEEKLKRYQELEDRRYEIKANELKKELELYKQDENKQREIMKQIEALDQDHALKIRSINNQMKSQAFAPFKSMADSLESSFSSALSKMMQGTMKFSTFLKGVFPTIMGAFADMAAKMVAKAVAEYVMGTSVMKALTTALGITQATTEATTSAATIASKKATAAETIPADAAMAAGAAAASVAAIPYVGWAMAPEVYAGTMGMVMSGLAVAAASGGFDIPSGVNPVTQLHQEEMVLPAHIANPLRQSLNGGGLGGEANITIHAVDAKSVKLLFTENGSALVSALQSQNRKFATK